MTGTIVQEPTSTPRLIIPTAAEMSAFAKRLKEQHGLNQLQSKVASPSEPPHSLHIEPDITKLAHGPEQKIACAVDLEATCVPVKPTSAHPISPTHAAIPLDQPTLKAQLLANVPTKWLYSDNHADCLGRIFEFVLTIHESKTASSGLAFVGDEDEREYLLNRAEKFVKAFNFPVLYPNLIGLTDAKIESLFNAKRKVFKKRKGYKGSVGCLSFVLEKEIMDAIPLSELNIKRCPLTHAELAYVLKTISLLVRKKQLSHQQRGTIKGKASYKLIPHSYFLGDYYKDPQKFKAPRLKPGLTAEEIWSLAFTAGVERGISLSRKRSHDYRLKYKKATGYALNAHKLPKIIRLLEKYEFIRTKKVPAKKLKSAFMYSYDLGQRSRISRSQNWMSMTPAGVQGVAA